MKTRTSGDAGTTRHIIVVALGCNVAVVVTLLSFIDICLNDQCLTDIQYLKIILKGNVCLAGAPFAGD